MKQMFKNNRKHLLPVALLCLATIAVLVVSGAESKEHKKVHIVHVPKPIYIKKPVPVYVEKKVPVVKVKKVFVPKPIIVKKKVEVPVIKKVHIIQKVKVPVIKKVPVPVPVKKIKAISSSNANTRLIVGATGCEGSSLH